MGVQRITTSRKRSAAGQAAFSSPRGADAFSMLNKALGTSPETKRPAISFRSFLRRYAKVKAPQGGTYIPFTFTGRPAVDWLVTRIDHALGFNGTGQPEADTVIMAAGGAQCGKTVLAEHLMAYLLAEKFLSVGYYLPDDDLVQAVVDTKFRPDVVDQIPHVAALLMTGKARTESGRQVNRKGAIMATDGTRYGQGYFRGCAKFPTTFSMDAAIIDERDDVPDNKARFIGGRMTASKLRLSIVLGTQRYHGAGMNREALNASEHRGTIACACGQAIVPEDHWPDVVRVALDGRPRIDDPRLTLEGDFKRPGTAAVTVATYDHEATYYLACPFCGTQLDRSAVQYVAQQPAQERQRRYSIFVSQLAIDAISLRLIVKDWCLEAVRDPEAMAAFVCDRLAKPKATAQQLTPALLSRARNVAPFYLSLGPCPTGAHRYAGLDTGDRFWFSCHTADAGKHRSRVEWCESISPANARTRVPQLFEALGITTLFIDIGNEREMARELVITLNGLAGQPKLSDDYFAHTVKLTPLLWWDGESKLWHGLRAAAVEFSMKTGSGIKHVVRCTQEGLHYPVIQCNRDESIQHLCNLLLTAEEGLTEVIDGKLRTEPRLLLPGHREPVPEILLQLDAHYLAGSRKEKNTDNKTYSFIDGVPNHLLLAGTYAELAAKVMQGTVRDQAGIGTVSAKIDRQQRINQRRAVMV